MAREGAREITLTYLNVRQSIAILISRLILIDVLVAILIIISYVALITGGNLINYNEANTPMFLSIFTVLGIIKVVISAYVVLEWLNEYYEITPDHIVHKSGIIFRKTEQYRLDHVRGMDVADSFLGEIFNFATVTLYDIRMNKYLDMYLIHNARRYAKVLKQLRPHIEMREDRVWIPMVNKEELTGGEEE